VNITVIELLVIISLDGYDRFRFHQQGRNEVQHHNRPEPAEKKEADHNDSRPKNRKIKVFGNASTHAQYNAVARAVEPTAKNLDERFPNSGPGRFMIFSIYSLITN
jgi:hypothetical protein